MSKRYITATELAEMEKCEAQLLYKLKYGNVMTRKLSKAANRGNQLHAKHHRAVSKFANIEHNAKRLDEKPSNALLYVAIVFVILSVLVWLNF